MADDLLTDDTKFMLQIMILKKQKTFNNTWLWVW